MRRRTVLGIGLGGLGAVLGGPQAWTQTTDGTTRLVFPFSAGSGGDAVARMAAQAIGAASGQPAIVDNRTGADGRLAIQWVKHASPTGETLLVTTGPTMWLMALVHPAPGYDPVADFAPVSLLARFDFCVAVANNTGIKSIADLGPWLKANPQKANYAIPGLGTIPHFIGTRLSKLLGVDMTRVVYRGAAPALVDLVGGQIPIIVVPLSDALQQHRAGTIRILAVSGAARSPFTPDVPTLRESGIDLTGDAWYGLWAPAGTPAAKVAELNKAVVAAFATPEVRQRLTSLGLVGVGSTPAQLAAAMTAATANWAPVIKQSGYRMEQ